MCPSPRACPWPADDGSHDGFDYAQADSETSADCVHSFFGDDLVLNGDERSCAESSTSAVSPDERDEYASAGRRPPLGFDLFDSAAQHQSLSERCASSLTDYELIALHANSAPFCTTKTL